MYVLRLLLLVAALAGSTTAAEAASRVFVIHGIPGVPVDVYASAAGTPVPASPTIPGFQPKQIVDVQAGPGVFDIRIFAAGANPQTAEPVIAALGVAIPNEAELSVLAHLDSAGMPTATVYRNDNTPVRGGVARVSVRHAAQAPAVQLVANGLPKLALTNPYFGDLEVPAQTLTLQLQVPFAGTPITQPAALTFASAARYFVYAIGSVEAGTFDFIVQVAR